MKTFQQLSAQRGFSLIELMVAMAISMVLMAALAAIFTQSINSREKIDREGQKIETARYSLDTLAEDIRLAGYYGTLAPGLPGATLANGATPADWVYVEPCSTASGALPGWDSTGVSAITVPLPIFGYEAHGTGSLPAALTACLDNYRTGTDVFVIRRASTASLTAGGTGYVAGDPYLQVSTCPEGAVDAQPVQPPPFVAKATTTSADFNMHVLGCSSTVPGSNASVRKLITRIYFISQCDDCVNNLDNDAATPGDGVPTLKMVELGIPATGGTVLKMKENVRTIAPGVENLHLEYGIDTTDDGSIDTWVVSNDDPRQTGSTGDAVTGMRLDASTENRWEDVMAIKLFLVSRDLKTTAGYTDTKSFVMGSQTVTAAGDAYRRRLTSSTIKLVNMAGRREAP
ncbi:MAG: PilW family protein [Sulfuritalea sp.]|nr:PilW family protein [Sulfuritalea sp.]